MRLGTQTLEADVAPQDVSEENGVAPQRYEDTLPEEPLSRQEKTSFRVSNATDQRFEKILEVVIREPEGFDRGDYRVFAFATAEGQSTDYTHTLDAHRGNFF